MRFVHKIAMFFKCRRISRELTKAMLAMLALPLSERQLAIQETAEILVFSMSVEERKDVLTIFDDLLVKIAK